MRRSGVGQCCYIRWENLIGATILLLFALLISMPAMTAEPILEFKTEQQAAMYLKLTKDHRCLKCQNQNLADSGADIAKDLKKEIYQRVIRGESASDISAYLVARYGDFVLYKPPFKAITYALWIGPFILLFLALTYALAIGRRSRTHSQSNQPDKAALARARKLLDE